MECRHNSKCRYTHGFFCEDCNKFFDRDSSVYRSSELLSSIYMVLHNINVDSIRSENGEIEEVSLMTDKIGIGKIHDNYEELISEAEIIIEKYGKNSDSASVILKEK